MNLLDCGPERDGAGELLPAPALITEAPDRRLAKGGGMREFTDKIFHRSRKRTDAFQGDGAIFFPVLEPSAPTTLTSWGRHPVRTPTTARCDAASHESRTPVSGGRWWDGLGDFGACNRALMQMVVGRHLRHSHLGGVFAWTPAIEGEDAGEQGLKTRASKVGRRGRSRHEDAILKP